MKALYKIILFFTVFQFAIVIINVLGVFPYTLYSDVEMSNVSSIDSPEDFIRFIFPLPDVPLLSAFETYFTFGMLVTIFLGVGAAVSKATHSWTPIVVTIIATSFVPMILNSYNFFEKLFVNWDSQALMYTGLLLGICIILIALFTIVETPTHGRSG